MESQHPTTGLFRRVFTSLSVIIVAAFLIRLGFALWELMTGPVQSEYAWEVGRIARSIVMGKGFGNPYPGVETGPTALFAPLYPAFLAGIFKIFGVYSYLSFIVAVITNGLFSALTCIPIYKIGQRVGGTTLAATSCWLWAIFPTAVIIPAEWIWDTSATALLATTILWVTLEIRDSIRKRDWIGYGLLWGLGLSLNPSIIAVLPFLIFWLFWPHRTSTRQWLPLAGTALAIMIACSVPWAVRNYVEFHRLIPFRSNFGLELWLGNNAEEHDYVPDSKSPYLNEPIRAQYIELGEIAFMQAKEAESIDYIRQDPGSFVHATWIRFLQTWFGVADNFRYVWSKGTARIRIPLGANFIVVLLGLISLPLLWLKRRQFWIPIVVFPLVFPCLYYITHPSLRYRHVIDPVLVLMAAFTLCYPALFLGRRKSVESAQVASVNR
jgi:4-amino-4-deoxy-L-arabinose transferase-like glycosyltransferase